MIVLAGAAGCTSGPSEPLPSEDTSPSPVRLGIIASPESTQALGVARWELQRTEPSQTAGPSAGSYLALDDAGQPIHEVRFEIVDAATGAYQYWLDGAEVDTDAEREQIATVIWHLHGDLKQEGALVAYSHSSCFAEIANVVAADLALGAALLAAAGACTIPLSPQCVGAGLAVGSATAWVASATADAACCRHATPSCPDNPPPPPDGECSCHCSPCCGQGQCCI